METYQADIIRAIIPIIRDSKDAEELAQDVFVRVYYALPTYQEKGFKTWITRIAVNLAIDEKRKRSRRAEKELEAWIEQGTNEVEEQMLRNETKKLIYEKNGTGSSELPGCVDGLLHKREKLSGDRTRTKGSSKNDRNKALSCEKMVEGEMEGGGVPMSHYPKEQWLNYVTDQLKEETRKEMEEHLGKCDQCLAYYIEEVTRCEQEISLSETFTDTVLAKVKSREGENKPERQALSGRLQPRKRLLLHYSVAAALTLVLTFSGVFEEISDGAKIAAQQEIQGEQIPMTEQLMDKIMAMINRLMTSEGGHQ